MRLNVSQNGKDGNIKIINRKKVLRNRKILIKLSTHRRYAFTGIAITIHTINKDHTEKKKFFFFTLEIILPDCKSNEICSWEVEVPVTKILNFNLNTLGLWQKLLPRANYFHKICKVKTLCFYYKMCNKNLTQMLTHAVNLYLI